MADSLGLWWVIPNSLAGMPLPRFDAERYESGASIDAFPDDLPALARAGVGAVVSLLSIPHLASIYRGAGVAFLSLPVPDGGALTIEQALELVAFIDSQLASGRRVAVHCEAGLGRTGTALATYLIAKGNSPEGAARRIREVEPAAIETALQVRFLSEFAGIWRSRSASGQLGKRG